MNNCMRDDITEYKTVTYENRQIKIFVLGKKEEEFLSTTDNFKDEHINSSLAMKMSRFGGD